MRFTACVTTMNRPKELNECLQALWNSDTRPYSVVVSDNSVDPTVQKQNQDVVSQYANTIYLEGPHEGVSSNRNNALKAVTPDTELVTFLADDICVRPDFISLAIARYQTLPPEKQRKAIFTGDNRNEFSPEDIGPLGVTFRGYFCDRSQRQDTLQVVNLYATVFPRSFLEQEQWDENIFLGQEDIELSLRALKLGYDITYCPELKVFDTCFSKTTLPSAQKGTLKDYEIYVAASRLYIGIKRFKYIFPNPFKLLAFTTLYYLHMTSYLLRRGSLQVWPAIIQTSNIQRL